MVPWPGVSSRRRHADSGKAGRCDGDGCGRCRRDAADAGGTPGKRTLTRSLPGCGPVQRKPVDGQVASLEGALESSPSAPVEQSPEAVLQVELVALQRETDGYAYSGAPERQGPGEHPSPHAGERERGRARSQGYNVEQNPTVEGRKNPDFRIDGEIYDNYAPTGSSPEWIFQRVEAKIKSGQTQRVVINLDGSKVDLEALRVCFEKYPMSGLRHVLVVKDGSVIDLWP